VEDSKDWFLLRSPGDCLYYTSDNPVVRYNTVNQNPLYGTLGLNSPGVEVYFPLNSHLCLAIYCDSLRQLLPGPIAKAIAGGGWCHASRENVKHSNSLQVFSSSRFVFCRRQEFGLVTEIIEKNRQLRTGRKSLSIRLANRLFRQCGR